MWKWGIMYAMGIIAVAMGAIAGMQSYGRRELAKELDETHERLEALTRSRRNSDGEVSALRRQAEERQVQAEEEHKARAELEEKVSAAGARIGKLEEFRQKALQEAAAAEAALRRERELRETADGKLRSALDELAKVKAELGALAARRRSPEVAPAAAAPSAAMPTARFDAPVDESVKPVREGVAGGPETVAADPPKADEPVKADLAPAREDDTGVASGAEAKAGGGAAAGGGVAAVDTSEQATAKTDAAGPGAQQVKTAKPEAPTKSEVVEKPPHPQRSATAGRADSGETVRRKPLPRPAARQRPSREAEKPPTAIFKPY